jgi:hypothetical protein
MPERAVMMTVPEMDILHPSENELFRREKEAGR